MKRIVIISVLLLLVAVVLVGCGGNETTTTPQTPQNGGNIEQPANGTEVFTLDELAQFDGKDGNPAYIAVDGIVYDVTDAPDWPEGDHAPCNLDAMAGKDLSDELEQAPPRMRDYVLALPVVGMLEE